MKSFWLFLFSFVTTPLSAELTEKVEHLDRGKLGISDKFSISRDGTLVYVLYRQDKDRNCSYENYIESFYVGGKTALQFTFIGGSRGTIIPSDTRAQVILSSEHDSWKPQGIMLESEQKALEYFDLQPDGFYRPVSDAEKKRRDGISEAGTALIDAASKGDGKAAIKAFENLKNTPHSKEPNQALEPTPTAVTDPAAQAPRQP
jgi:hypothetical protein